MSVLHVSVSVSVDCGVWTVDYDSAVSGEPSLSGPHIVVVGHRGFISFLVDKNQVDFGNCSTCLFLPILASYFDWLTISSEIHSYQFTNAEGLEEQCYGVHKPQCENDFGPLLVKVPLVLVL